MRPFMFVGNHPCLDFVNTQMVIKGELTDLLGSFEDLLLWLLQAKLLTGFQSEVIRAELNQTEAQSILEQAQALRMTLRGIAERVAARKPIPDSAIETINHYFSQRAGFPQLVRKKGRFQQRFHSTAPEKHGLPALLAEAASDLLCNTDLALIKKCGNAACILYFLDTTKNHRRHWCSMQLCGNRMKVAAYFQRKRNLPTRDPHRESSTAPRRSPGPA